MVALGAGRGAFRAGVADSHGHGVDDGEVFDCTGDGPSYLGGTANDVDDKVASGPLTGVLGCLNRSVVLLPFCICQGPRYGATPKQARRSATCSTSEEPL